MKRILLVAAVLATALIAARLPAADTGSSKWVKPDWHYRWHENRWWYWMPESKSWMVWSDSNWVPFEQSKSMAISNISQSTEAASGATEETAPVGQNCPTTTSGTYSGGQSYSGGYYGGGYSGGGYSGGGANGSGYAGYGWSWGPGTAFSSPGARF